MAGVFILLKCEGIAQIVYSQTCYYYSVHVYIYILVMDIIAVAGCEVVWDDYIIHIIIVYMYYILVMDIIAVAGCEVVWDDYIIHIIIVYMYIYTCDGHYCCCWL